MHTFEEWFNDGIDEKEVSLLQALHRKRTFVYECGAMGTYSR